MSETPKKMVLVESLEWHTYDGQGRDVGTTYELPESLVESVRSQGKARPVAEGTAHREPVTPVVSTATGPTAPRSTPQTPKP
ncbi:MAG TPA: hypothetical protein VIX63_11035 [Vicinamibacterales bacterium]